MQVQDAPFGKVYKWCHESVVVEYKCGERLTLTNLETTASGAAQTIGLLSKKSWTLSSLTMRRGTPGVTWGITKKPRYLSELTLG